MVDGPDLDEMGHQLRDGSSPVRRQMPGDLIEAELTPELRLEPAEEAECPGSTHMGFPRWRANEDAPNDPAVSRQRPPPRSLSGRIELPGGVVVDLTRQPARHVA
jgi:hypothetical protein